MKILPLLILFLAACLTSGMPVNQSGIDTNYYKSALNYLASDKLEGRKPGTRGGDLAAEYIADQFKSIGLSPVSEEKGYLQMVPFIEVTTDYPNAQVVIHSDDKKDSVKPFEEILLNSQNPEEAVNESAELVFTGYGVVAPEYDWDDFKGMDVTGKILLMIDDDPDFKKTGFGSEGSTFYGSLEYKEKIAMQRGAKGIILLHSVETMGIPFELLQDFFSSGTVFPLSKSGGQLAVRGLISKTAADRILGMKDYSFDKLKEMSDNRDFQPVFLGLKAEISFNQKLRNFESANVIGILPGTENKDEAVIFSAHYDHLGIGRPVNGDSIYNGAEDNAGGTAALLTLAKTSAKIPRREVLYSLLLPVRRIFL